MELGIGIADKPCWRCGSHSIWLDDDGVYCLACSRDQEHPLIPGKLSDTSRNYLKLLKAIVNVQKGKEKQEGKAEAAAPNDS